MSFFHFKEYQSCTCQTMIQLLLKCRFVIVRFVRIPGETMALANDHPKDQEKGSLDPCHDCQRLNKHNPREAQYLKTIKII